MGAYDYWSPPGGGVEGDEELTETVLREVFEETRLNVAVGELAYIDELIDNNGRMLKLWYFADYLGGEIDLTNNPALDEGIVEARWVSEADMPQEPIFPPVLASGFWRHLQDRSVFPVKLPLIVSYF